MKAFYIDVTGEKLLFNNFAVFDFESIGVKSSTKADTETTTWFGKYEQISMSLKSNLRGEVIFHLRHQTSITGVQFGNTFGKLSRK